MAMEFSNCNIKMVLIRVVFFFNADLHLTTLTRLISIFLKKKISMVVYRHDMKENQHKQDTLKSWLLMNKQKHF